MPEKKDNAQKKTTAPKTTAKKKSTVKRASAVQDKQAADTERRDDQVAEGQLNIPEPSDAQVAEEKRRDGIRRNLVQNQGTIDSLDAQVEQLREQSAKLLLALYPQQGANDPHHKAVKGFLAASRMERANRASTPAKLKALLENMQKSPIDAAMTRHTKRGTRRPDRPMKPNAAGA
jgi:hypothetical protein